MKKAKIYKPSKTAMQSGTKKFNKWIIEFNTKDTGINPLMGWETSSDTLSEVKLEFSTKKSAIEYAKRNMWNDAKESWESVLKEKSSEAIKDKIHAKYNIGVYHEIHDESLFLEKSTSGR